MLQRKVSWVLCPLSITKGLLLSEYSIWQDLYLFVVVKKKKNYIWQRQDAQKYAEKTVLQKSLIMHTDTFLGFLGF